MCEPTYDPGFVQIPVESGTAFVRPFTIMAVIPSGREGCSVINRVNEHGGSIITTITPEEVMKLIDARCAPPVQVPCSSYERWLPNPDLNAEDEG